MKIARNGNKIPNDSNRKVYVAKSKIVSKKEGFATGNGLFVDQSIKQNEILAYYAGEVIDEYDVKNKIDTTYCVGLWNKFVLVGDSFNGDLGIFANEYSDREEQNAKFDKDNIIIYDSKIGIVKSTGWNNSESTTMRDRAIFPIIAMRDIEKDEEILVKYGTCQSHFKKTSQSSQNSRSTESIERNQRYEIREQKKILDGLKKNQA